MSAASAWAPVGPARLGLFPGGPASPATNDTALTSIASPSEAAVREAGTWSKENPLLAVLAIAGLTMGLIAFSTSGSVSVRLGKSVASVGGAAGVGSTK